MSDFIKCNTCRHKYKTELKGEPIWKCKLCVVVGIDIPDHGLVHGTSCLLRSAIHRCPFCGHHNLRIRHIRPDSNRRQVTCMRCGAKGPYETKPDNEYLLDIIKKWNAVSDKNFV